MSDSRDTEPKSGDRCADERNVVIFVRLADLPVKALVNPLCAVLVDDLTRKDL